MQAMTFDECEELLISWAKNERLEEKLDFSAEKGAFSFPQPPQGEGALDPDEASKRPAHEVADVFRLYGEEYRSKHTLTSEQARAMHDIEHCRTAEMGEHWDVCDMCGHIEKSYCSCHNRHCPKCHGAARRIWVRDRLNDLLPVPYYHVVFTLPDEELHALYPYNEKLLYDLLFDCSAETLLLFGRDPKWLGAWMGFFGILHTWGQTMWRHPHIHYVVPGGGINEAEEWVKAKFDDTFLFPVKALSMRFRKLFTEGLKEGFDAGLINFPPDWKHGESPKAFGEWLGKLGHKEFVVFTKAPLGGPEGVVKYVGRYTHRVAISNHRILSIEGGVIRFSYKDYRSKDENGEYEWKEMSLEADEFIHRFLCHILPKGFHKIRHFGFLGNGKKAVLDRIKLYLLFEEGVGSIPGIEEKCGLDECGVRICPVCKVGGMLPVVVIHRYGTIVIRNLSFLRIVDSFNTS